MTHKASTGRSKPRAGGARGGARRAGGSLRAQAGKAKGGGLRSGTGRSLRGQMTRGANRMAAKKTGGLRGRMPGRAGPSVRDKPSRGGSGRRSSNRY